MKGYFTALGMQVKEQEDKINDDVPYTIDDHEMAGLLVIDGKRRLPRSVDAVAEDEREQEFKGIDIEQHDKDQRAVENDRQGILDAVAAKEDMLLMPDEHQYGEADAEGNEAAHRDDQLFEAFGNFEGHDEQGDRKGKDGVAEGLDPFNLMTAEMETRMLRL